MTKLNYIDDVSCRNCVHNRGRTCRAFPEGIPFRFLSGQLPHDEPVEGDGGIQFEPIEKEDKEALLGIKLERA